MKIVFCYKKYGKDMLSKSASFYLISWKISIKFHLEAENICFSMKKNSWRNLWVILKIELYV